MIHVVAPIIQNNIHTAHFCYNGLQESSVGLGTYPHLSCKSVKALALRVDINAKNNCVLS